MIELKPETVYNCTKCTNRPKPEFKPRWGTEMKGKKIMVVGIAPGCGKLKEDINEKTFIEDYINSVRTNMVGKYINALLLPLGLNIDDCFMTNLVKCPVGTNTPDEEMIDNCKLYLHIQIQMCNPDIIILLGKPPIMHFFPELDKPTQVHGHCMTHNGRKYILSTHPGFWMRQEYADKHLLEEQIRETIRRELK